MPEHDGNYEDAARKLKRLFKDFAAEIDNKLDDLDVAVDKLTEDADEAVGSAYQQGNEEGMAEGRSDGYLDAIDEAVDMEGILCTAWTRLHPHEPSDGWLRTREEPWYTIEAELHHVKQQRGDRAA